MMHGPLVSVVMAMYNARPYVADAVESVLRQDYDNFELVVIDDGSTDGSSKVVERFTDPRIRLIRTENRGTSAARNMGIAQAHGAYVTFLDGDDLLLPRSLSSRLAGFENHDADCVFCSNLIVIYAHAHSETRNPVPRHDPSETGRPWPAEFLIEQFIERKFYVFAQAFLISRPILQAIGGFDETLRVSEDVEFFSRLLPACHTLVETFEPYYVYRRIPNSLSAINSRRKAEGTLHALQQTHRNLAPYLCGREVWRAQSLFSTLRPRLSLLDEPTSAGHDGGVASAGRRAVRPCLCRRPSSTGGSKPFRLACGTPVDLCELLSPPKAETALRRLFDEMAGGRAVPTVDGANIGPST